MKGTNMENEKKPATQRKPILPLLWETNPRVIRDTTPRTMADELRRSRNAYRIACFVMAALVIAFAVTTCREHRQPAAKAGAP